MGITMMGTDASYTVDKVGVFRPQGNSTSRNSLRARSASSPPRSRKWPIPASAIPSRKKSAPARICCRAFKPVQPVVFCGLFPVDAGEFDDLRQRHGPPAPQRCQLLLRDGEFRRARLRLPLRLPRDCCIWRSVQERLSREFDLDLISTAPSVVYKLNHARRPPSRNCTTPPTLPDVDEDRGMSREPLDPRHES